jgi:hypothetical protein
MGGRNLCQLLLDFDPDGHRIHSNRLAGQARDEDVTAMKNLKGPAKSGGNLEPALFIDLGRRVPSEGGVLLHFAPLWTTVMLKGRPAVVNRKILERLKLRDPIYALSSPLSL